MPNEVIFIIMLAFYLGSVLLTYKLFGKNGIYAYAVFATLIGNIAVCKCVDLFGLSATAGNVQFAATFLITDILSEKYGKKDASRAVQYSLAMMIFWMIGTQMILWFAPNANDYVSESMKQIFSLAPRVTAACILSYIVSQNLDIILYHKLWEKTGGGSNKLWLRNNVATMTSQAIDTLLFTSIAFWGVYPTNVFLGIMLTTYLFKVVVALFDTPFIYLARKVTPRGEVE